MLIDLNQALVLPISGNGNHRHMQSLVGMRSAALIPPVSVDSITEKLVSDFSLDFHNLFLS